MSNAHNTPAAFVIVDGVRINLADIHAKGLDVIVKEMIDASRKEYGSHIRIAAKLNDMLPFPWFDIDPKEVSDDAYALEPHK